MYVREWRLNHEPADRPTCPTCKSVDAFEDALFPLEESSAAFSAERKRRADEARNEQVRSDAETAEALFYEDFGDYIFRRRNAMRRRDLAIFLRLADAIHSASSTPS